MTKRKKLYIIIGSIVLAVLIAASIAVPILVINSLPKVPTPVFAEFDQLSDMTIKVEWEKVYKATSYDIEYCYGNPAEDGAVIIDGSTQNTAFSIERKKGVLSVRARASFDNNKGSFSSWVRTIIAPIKLSAPYVTISDALTISWSEAKYNYYTTKKNVPLYVYDLNIRVADEDTTSINNSTQFNSINIAEIIVSRLGNYDYTEENWDDVFITVSVKAVNYSILGSDKITVGEYAFVYNVYDESDYKSAEYTVTLEAYQRLKASLQG